MKIILNFLKFLKSFLHFCICTPVVRVTSHADMVRVHVSYRRGLALSQVLIPIPTWSVLMSHTDVVRAHVSYRRGPLALSQVLITLCYSLVNLAN